MNYSFSCTDYLITNPQGRRYKQFGGKIVHTSLAGALCLVSIQCVSETKVLSLRQNTAGKIRTHVKEIIGSLISSDSVLGKWMPEFESQD